MRQACTALIGLALLQSCAIREPFRPRHEGRRMVEAQLGCANVEIAPAPQSPYVEDLLLLHPERLIAWGCGRVARLECDPFGMRNGTCRADPSYESPPLEQPQGTIKVLTRYESSEGLLQREQYQIAGLGKIVRRADPQAFAFPLKAGPARISIASDPVMARVLHHYWTTTTTERRNGRTYHVTKQHHRHTVDLYTEPGCALDFTLDVEADATYRVLFTYIARNQCQVECAREVQTPHGTDLISCAEQHSMDR